MPRSVPKRLAPLGLLAALALTGGCAATAPTQPAASPSPHPTLTAGTAPTYTSPDGQARLLSDGSVILPLDAYDGFTSAADRPVMERTTTLVEQKCMQAKGYQLPAGYGTQFIPEPMSPLQMYGVSSTKEAWAFGYRAPDSADATAASQANVPQPVLAAFQGDASGAGGCRAAAFQELDYPATTAAFTFIQNLRVTALEDATRNNQFVRVTAAWSACMAKVGYHYATPIDPGRDVSLLDSGASVPPGDDFAPYPTVAEKTAANDDVACKYQSDYLQTFTQLVGQYQEQLIAQNASHLAQIRTLWTSTVDLARKLA